MTGPDFLAALQPLLTEEQAGQLPGLLARWPDPERLARELIGRGWLTSFQAEQLIRGKGDDLLLDQYVLLDLLGQGGMGQVFRARQTRMKRLVALKVIRRECLASPIAVERFRREAEAVARLSHPNVVLVYDTNEVNGIHFLVMEFLEGTDLARLVKQEGRLPVSRACDYIHQAALGLQHAFERGLVHRDVKPANLMLTANGCIKLMDLGLARAIDAGSTSTEDYLTAPGAILGTPAYMAPEQLMDAHQADIRADIYSLGCTLFQLLTAQVPFNGTTPMQVMAGHLHGKVPAPAEFGTEVPPDLEAALRRMMAKQPEERFQTPAQVAAALAAFVAPDAPSDPTPLLPPEPRTPAPGPTDITLPVLRLEPIPRRSRKLLLGSLAAVVLLGVGLVLFRALAPASPQATVAERTTHLAPSLEELYLGNGITLELVRIEPGQFRMGSPDSDLKASDDERPQQWVEIRKPFYLGKYPVTQKEYEQVMHETPSWFSVKGGGSEQVKGHETSRHPVEYITWDEAQTFCRKARALTRRRVELPTEAEWEYACRAGTESRYPGGDVLTSRDANFDNDVRRTSSVGELPANRWRLHDMIGNVGQWCADGKRTYGAGRAVDPEGPTNDDGRMVRGGSWADTAADCRSASRGTLARDKRSEHVGFRVLVRPD